MAAAADVRLSAGFSAGGGGAPSGDLISSVKQQQEKYDQLSRQLERERQDLARDLEQAQLGSETASLNSISETDDSFQYRPHVKVDDYSDTESRASTAAPSIPGSKYGSFAPPDTPVPQLPFHPDSRLPPAVESEPPMDDEMDYPPERPQLPVHYANGATNSYPAQSGRVPLDRGGDDYDGRRPNDPRYYNQPQPAGYNYNPNYNEQRPHSPYLNGGMSPQQQHPARPRNLDGPPKHPDSLSVSSDPRSPGVPRTPGTMLEEPSYKPAYTPTTPNSRYTPGSSGPNRQPLGSSSRGGVNSSLPPSNQHSPSINSRSFPAGATDPNDLPDNTLARVTRWRNPTLLEVIEYLDHRDIRVVLNAAAYLQHLTYDDEAIKNKVRELHAIPMIARLLENANPDLKRNLLGALRNCSYGKGTMENKFAMMNAGCISLLARILRTNNDPEIQELACAVLWNLSSEPEIKRNILDEAMPTIVSTVVIPESGWLEDDERKMNPNEPAPANNWSQLFRNATGCIRNLSAEGQDFRRRLRETDNLIDALIHVLKVAIARKDVHGRAVENAVCIIRNLTFHLAQELEAAKDPRYQPDSRNALSRTNANKEKTTGCAPGKKSGKKAGRSHEALQYTAPDIPESDPHARGVELLWQPNIMLQYIALLNESSNPDTLEAAAGAVQNMCAGDFVWCPGMRFTMRKRMGLPVLRNLIGTFDNDFVVAAVAGALKNLALDQKNRELIGLHATQEVVKHLPHENEREYAGVYWDKVAMVLLCLQQLCKDNLENCRHLRNCNGIPRIIHLAKSRNVNKVSPRVIKLAEQLLKELWAVKAMRDSYKEDGLLRAHFMPGARVGVQKTHEVGTLSNTLGRARSANDVNTGRKNANSYNSTTRSYNNSRSQSAERHLDDYNYGQRDGPTTLDNQTNPDSYPLHNVSHSVDHRNQDPAAGYNGGTLTVAADQDHWV